MLKSSTLSKFLLTTICSLTLLTACSSAAAPRQFTAESQGAAPAAPSVAEKPAASSDNVYAVNAPNPQVNRLVVKNAKLSIVVLDPSKSIDTISSMAEEMGGFVVSANLYHSQLDSGVEVPHGAITIRVQAERLDEAITRIQSESSREPLNKTIQSQDVTKEYTDLQSRLRNLEDAEAQLREIMGSASKTEDVLNVYNQLTQVREQIEVIKGQIQYYEQAAALSEIEVDLLANEAVQPLTIGGWQPVGVAKNAVQALINTLKFLVNAAIWVIILVIPVAGIFYLIFILPLTLLWRAWRRRRALRKQAAQPAPPAA
jgi:hypothetical protein